MNTAGKGFEKMLQPRILNAEEAAGDLCPQQHDFRRGRSTIGAVKEATDAITRAQTGNHRSRGITLLVTFDDKNAFNSARWTEFLKGLNNFAVPKHLMRVMRSYLSDRMLLYDTLQGKKSRKVTAGADQGSILGPDLWNISCDGILRLELVDGCFMIGYADEIALVIVARKSQ